MKKIDMTINKLKFFMVKKPQKGKLIKSLIVFLEELKNAK